ncbi:MAG: peptidase S41, partial [Planctomycetaceae bacterium]|nr:peptidase S41 [Planctomycetaceae bacterium]
MTLNRQDPFMNIVSSIAFSFFVGTSATTLPVAKDGGASMYRFPDISNEEIVFTYGNDLWRVPIEGGTALPLASPDGLETIPRFSPDGDKVAFVGNYDGNRDIYVVPTKGGMPRRITHHPTGERLSDWTADGDLLYSARGMGGVPRAERIYRVGGEGGLPEALPMPYGANAAIDKTGTWVAYTPNQRDGRTWKRYRGGMASDIWLVNLETDESRRVTDWEGTDTMPMWHGDDLYFLSDAGDEHRLNLWRYDVESGDREQLTRFADYDIKWPAIGPDDDGPARFVFQNGADLYVHDARNRVTTPVEIEIPGATASLRPQMVDASDFMQGWSISPSGKRVAATARGDLWTLPAKNGSPRNLSRTSGVAERSPSWSPDGKWIAYFSDAPGEYELFVRRSDGRDEPRRLTDDLGVFKNAIHWGPDSSFIVYADKTGDAHRVDV